MLILARSYRNRDLKLNEERKLLRDIQISDHFDYSTMLLFSLPTIGTLVVDSTYVVADGFFNSLRISFNVFSPYNANYLEI